MPFFPSTASYQDVDTTSFISRAGIVIAIQMTAVTTLISSLKSNNLWDKLTAAYPLIGGYSTSHAVNLKSSSYTISWSGTVTHDGKGITGNGSTGYGDLGGAENVILAGNTNLHLSAYLSTQPPADSSVRISIGGGNAYMGRYRDGSSNSMSFYMVGASANFTTGFSCVSQTVSGSLMAQSNATQSTFTGSDATLGSTNINILRFTSGVQYSDLTHSFISAGSGLSASDATNLYNAVSTFQTSLGRNA